MHQLWKLWNLKIRKQHRLLIQRYIPTTSESWKFLPRGNGNMDWMGQIKITIWKKWIVWVLIQNMSSIKRNQQVTSTSSCQHLVLEGSRAVLTKWLRKELWSKILFPFKLSFKYKGKRQMLLIKCTGVTLVKKTIWVSNIRVYNTSSVFCTVCSSP